jgi:membrane associated rhomboid family serine protease
MGVYDRDYYREDRQGLHLTISAWSAVTTLIVINVAVAVVGFFLQTNPVTHRNWLTEYLALQPDLFHNPWNFWQLLTYGFVHDQGDIWHLAFNMLGLWIFGREVEVIYGRREFFKLYISLIVLSGLFDQIIQFASQSLHPVIGASGGVVGLAVIFACHFPRRMMLIFPIPIPIPAALMVGIFVVMEFLATRSRGDAVAHWVHLGGAAFGFLYYKTGWNLFRLWPGNLKLRLPMRGPKFRIHREPEENEEQSPPDDYLTTGRVQQRVDQILEKISRTGESSLTEEERRFLADASRRYQQQRRR